MRRKRHVYVVGDVAFVRHPLVRGAWLRTDAAVFVAGCSYCGAKRGELCRGATPSGRTSGTHSARRYSAKMRRRRERKALERGKKTIVHLEIP